MAGPDDTDDNEPGLAAATRRAARTSTVAALHAERARLDARIAAMDARVEDPDEETPADRVTTDPGIKSGRRASDHIEPAPSMQEHQVVLDAQTTRIAAAGNRRAVAVALLTTLGTTVLLPLGYYVLGALFQHWGIAVPPPPMVAPVANSAPETAVEDAAEAEALPPTEPPP